MFLTAAQVLAGYQREESKGMPLTESLAGGARCQHAVRYVILERHVGAQTRRVGQAAVGDGKSRFCAFLLDSVSILDSPYFKGSLLLTPQTGYMPRALMRSFCADASGTAASAAAMSVVGRIAAE